MSDNEKLALTKRIADLEKQLADKKAARIRVGVSEKGAVSLYGLRRFPITLYASEWAIVADKMPMVQTFIKENASSLKQQKED